MIGSGKGGDSKKKKEEVCETPPFFDSPHLHDQRSNLQVFWYVGAVVRSAEHWGVVVDVGHQDIQAENLRWDLPWSGSREGEAVKGRGLEV